MRHRGTENTESSSLCELCVSVVSYKRSLKNRGGSTEKCGGSTEICGASLEKSINVTFTQQYRW